MLSSADQVIRCLVTYTDWWQPTTSSVLLVGNAKRDKAIPDGLRAGLLETLDLREELRRRVWQLDELDRHLLLLWYVDQLPTEEVATRLRISRRQCFRRRANAVRKIVELGEPERAA